MRDTTAALADWLEQGGRRIGQIAISPAYGGWELRHVDDVARDILESFANAFAARALANLDDAGAYRPLKTAPNLRHGWRLVLRDVAAVRRALEAFYPAMIGLWLAQRAGELTPVHLRETLGRQTGMYRVTQRLSDAQAQELTGRFCESGRGCLKTILWRVDTNQPITTLLPEKFQPAGGDALPLLCHEACNLLVGAARKVVKE